ncbi:MAG TPA: hypothetical protein DCO75_01350 [Fibrobacteres bacterium]|nr:hypothetical protein [Fibrobacterota bacterium]
MKVNAAICYFIFLGVISVFSQPPSNESSLSKQPEMPQAGFQGGMHCPNGNSQAPEPIMSGLENPPLMMMNITELQTLMNEINIEKPVSTKILAISRGFLNSFETKILKVQKEELNIKEELLKDKPDMQTIQNAINKKSQAFGDIEFAQIKRDVEIKSLLSQDEYDRWKSAMMKKMKQFLPQNKDKNQNFSEKKGPAKSGR